MNGLWLRGLRAVPLGACPLTELLMAASTLPGFSIKVSCRLSEAYHHFSVLEVYRGKRWHARRPFWIHLLQSTLTQHFGPTRYHVRPES